MIILKANNQALTDGQRFSYLSTNYASGVSSVVVANANAYSADDYVVIGEWGVETTEIMKISTVTAATNTLTFTANTRFAHANSSRVTVTPYNQVQFYRTTTDTFSASTVLATYDVQADDFFTRYFDTTYSTGYGWYRFYNSTTTDFSTNSSAIPYEDFADNSVKRIMDDFFSMLNNKDKSLIDGDDAFRWLNEAYSIAQNHLNLINQEYNVPALYTISTTAGTQEYTLPSDFSGIISIYKGNEKLNLLNISDIEANQDNNTYYPNYYIRSSVIGFVPDPGTSSINMYYKSKATRLTSYYDNLNFPNNNYYMIVDYMLMRAHQKLRSPKTDIDMYKAMFDEKIAVMKMTAVKQNGGLESWGIVDEANA